ncbi:MAG TPA: deoxyribose-phosphate aldolase [Pyrodictium sp.]|nr:deoxyribose-phosphate aldolase [Pyrodictium sp.]
MNKHMLAQRIDVAILKPWLPRNEIDKLLMRAKELQVRCIIVTPSLLEYAANILGVEVCVGSVAGFPFGYSPIESKIKEVEEIIDNGAKEIDFVPNYQKLTIYNNVEYVFNEIRAIAEIARTSNVVFKLIVEVPALPKNIVKKLVEIGVKVGVDYIKTSTGFAPRHTTTDDVLFLRHTLEEFGAADKVGIKAAGGIRNCRQALELIKAGASIIGTSAFDQVLSSCE